MSLLKTALRKLGITDRKGFDAWLDAALKPKSPHKRLMAAYDKSLADMELAAARYDLWLSANGKRLDPHLLGEMLRKYLKKADIKKDISPHGIRHACATHLLSRNANLRHIQELLGHSSIQFTQIYTSVAITDLKKVIASCHPRNQDRFVHLESEGQESNVVTFSGEGVILNP